MDKRYKDLNEEEKKQYFREYYKKNKNYLKKYQRNWKKKNKDYIKKYQKKYQKKWNKKNKERIKGYKERRKKYIENYHKKNKKYIKKIQREWRKKDIKKVKSKINITKITGMVCDSRNRTRELIRIRDNFTCQKCGKKWIIGQRRFDVHHKDFNKEKSRKADNYEKEKDNMITLCHKCHLNLPEHRKAMMLLSRKIKESG